MDDEKERPDAAATASGPKEELHEHAEYRRPEPKGQAVTGETKEAVRFLSMFRAAGPWVLTAIRPDQKFIETQTFTDPAKAEQWIEERNGKLNLYFNVNPVIKAVKSKAAKTDTRGMEWIHVDVDPRANEGFEEERARILDALRQYNPPPTIILDSGNGYQGFWKLDKEYRTDGSEQKAEELEGYNLQIELTLGADSCHDICRIMRLPATWNLPTDTKKKKGRVRALAKSVDVDPSRVYELNAAFTRATRASHSGTATCSGISDNLPKVDLNSLPVGVTDRIKALIVQGTDPDEPGKYKSRSEAVFAVACALVKAGVGDDVIASILLDPDFGISDHILAQKRPRRYAVRQVKQAREEVISPHLRKLNEEHFIVLNEGGKTRVWERIPDTKLRRESLSAQTFDDFRNRYMNVHVEAGRDSSGEPVTITLGKFWLGHALRRQYKRFLFVPGGDEIIDDCLNLWRGFGVEAKQGPWPLMREHIRKVLAAGDPASDEYIMRWGAWAVQHPGEQAEAALVFKGKSGTGKGTFGRAMRDLFGQHGMQVNSALHLAGRFNSHLRDVCLLFADEAIRPGDRAGEKILYGMLTEDVLTIEAKGKDAVPAQNHVKVIMASNDEWVVPMNMQDRRFAVFEVSEAHMKDDAYFKALNAELDAGGREAMLFDLLNMPLGNWHPRHNIPNTHARNQQKIATLKGTFAADFYNMLGKGELPVGNVYDKGQNGEWFLPTSEMEDYCRKHLRRDFSFNDIGNVLGKKGLGFVQGRDGWNGPRGYILPPLPEARSVWDQKQAPGDWDVNLKEDWVFVSPEPDDACPF